VSHPGRPALVGGAAGAERASERSAESADDGQAPDWVTTDLDVLMPEAAASTSLDNNGQSRTPRQPWSRKQKRIYHRVNSVLTYWEARGYQIRWVMLSSSASSDPAKLAPHHRAVLRRVDRQLGFHDVEWFYVITREGFGVIHAFWAWHVPQDERQRVFWVPQPWLSAQWSAIHGAEVVWIAAYSNKGRSRSRVSRYVTTQYVADQDALVRMGWSWRRTFGFPLARSWQAFKKMHRSVPAVGGMQRLVRNWEAVMRGEELEVNGDIYSLDVLRELRLWRRAQLEGGR
jgi:hypothetical protein